MAAETKAKDKAEGKEPEAEVEDEAMESVSRWEFVDEIPTPETVLELMRTLPDVFGVKPVDFVEYVVPISQNSKVKVKTQQGAQREVWHEVWRLYMSVAGRQAMLQAAQEANGWTVSFVPENAVNNRDAWPGVWVDGDRLVYREYCSIEKDGKPLGRKPGMAHVKREGGQGAAGSNPYEKVETAARGRAIAAWGFGVLPGSGVASLEEIYGALGSDVQPVSQPRQKRLSPEETIEEIRVVMEEVRQIRGDEPEVMRTKMLQYLYDSFGLSEGEVTVIPEGKEPEEAVIDWSKLKEAQLTLTLNQLRSSIQKIRAEQQPV